MMRKKERKEGGREGEREDRKEGGREEIHSSLVLNSNFPFCHL